jgi:hypothetical protein
MFFEDNLDSLYKNINEFHRKWGRQPSRICLHYSSWYKLADQILSNNPSVPWYDEPPKSIKFLNVLLVPMDGVFELTFDQALYQAARDRHPGTEPGDQFNGYGVYEARLGRFIYPIAWRR